MVVIPGLPVQPINTLQPPLATSSAVPICGPSLHPYTRGGSSLTRIAPLAHQRPDHVGLPVLIAEVEDGHDVGVVAEAGHGLRLSYDPLA